MFTINNFQSKITKLKGATEKAYTSFLNSFSGEYYGIRLLKPKMALLGYFSLIAILYALLLWLPYDLFANLSYVNFTEQNIGIVTVLLTVLLSAGFVFLGDDTRGWSLARVTIIRDVVQLQGLVIAVIIICGISIIPEITLHNHSLKELASPLLVASYLFIINIFIKVYRWLSDLAADPQLFNNDDVVTESRTFPSKSYRFARIVYTIRHNNRRDVWQSILERKIPEGYEEFIHQEFFNASNEMIVSQKTNKLQELSLLIEIYEKYYNIRNLNSWRFEIEYINNFLSLYNQICKILLVDRPEDVKLAVLWRGKSSLERIIDNQVKALLDGHKVYSLFEAMNSYITDANLAYPTKKRKGKSTVLDNFIKALLEALSKADRLSTYDIESWVDNKEHWQITYSNLFDKKDNVTFTLLNHFEEWLFATLDRYEQQKDKDKFLLEVDSIISLFFKEVDPIDFSKLYWFKYNAKNTTDAKLIAKLISTKDRPFGHIGRVDVEFVAGSREESLERFRKKQQALEQSSIKLFAYLNGGYFTSGFWDINAIIKELKAVIKGLDEDTDQEVDRVTPLIQDLKSIKKELKI